MVGEVGEVRILGRKMGMLWEVRMVYISLVMEGPLLTPAISWTQGTDIAGVLTVGRDPRELMGDLAPAESDQD